LQKRPGVNWLETHRCDVKRLAIDSPGI
jgi:hypothetical protein